jgi:hypothetical protein
MNFIFAMDLSRPLSIVQNQGTSGSINITSVSAVINSASLLLQQYTPEASIEQPLQMVLPYSQVTRYQTQGPTVTPFQTGISITANNLQFNSIPRYVFGYSSRPDQSRTSFMTDAIFPLSNPLSLGKPVNFLFDNRPNLNTATAWDLYLMSVRAGLMMSWTQWSSQVGSIVCVDLGAGDIGLQDWQSPSVTGNYNVQISMVFDNPFNETINMVLNILAVYDGTFNMRNNVTTVSPSILTPEDVLKARQNDSVQAFEASKTIAGGSFLDVIKQVGNFGKKAYCDPTARKVICGEALPSLAAIGMAGKAAYCNPSLRKAVCGSGVVGNGVVGGCGQCCGGARSGGVRKKKSMKGGRRMTKRELQRRIM